MTTTPQFIRALPVAKAIHPDTLLALRMNGKPLAPNRGKPARMVVSGWVGDDWVRYRCADPRYINPQIVARLAERHMPIIALAELPRRLEEVYLSIVADEQVERGVWSADAGSQGPGARSQEPEIRPPTADPQEEELRR